MHVQAGLQAIQLTAGEQHEEELGPLPAAVERTANGRETAGRHVPQERFELVERDGVAGDGGPEVAGDGGGEARARRGLRCVSDGSLAGALREDGDRHGAT